MPRLSGSLAHIGLAALLRFLADLRTTGRLELGNDPWKGEVCFDNGRVVAATFGPESGRVALEAMALLLAADTFELHDATPPAARDEQLASVTAAELASHLEEVLASRSVGAAALPPLDARLSVAAPAEWLGANAEASDGGASVVVTRRALWILLQIRDEQPSVGALAARWGLLATLEAVAELTHLKLVSADSVGDPAHDEGTHDGSVGPRDSARQLHGR